MADESIMKKQSLILAALSWRANRARKLDLQRGIPQAKIFIKGDMVQGDNKRSGYRTRLSEVDDSQWLWCTCMVGHDMSVEEHTAAEVSDVAVADLVIADNSIGWEQKYNVNWKVKSLCLEGRKTTHTFK